LRKLYRRGRDVAAAAAAAAAAATAAAAAAVAVAATAACERSFAALLFPLNF